MVDSVNLSKTAFEYTPVVHHDSNVLIDDKEIKGILFLGIQGDLSNIIDDNKVDLLA